MTSFQPTVTLQSEQSGRISWSDLAGLSYWINVNIDGDRVAKIRPAMGRETPTLFRARPADPGKRAGIADTSRLDATSPKWAEVVGAMVFRANQGLIAQARAEAIEAGRVQAAERITAKAEAVRRLMARHGIRVPEISEASFAAFYDDVQNAA